MAFISNFWTKGTVTMKMACANLDEENDLKVHAFLGQFRKG